MTWCVLLATSKSEVLICKPADMVLDSVTVVGQITHLLEMEMEIYWPAPALAVHLPLCCKEFAKHVANASLLIAYLSQMTFIATRGNIQGTAALCVCR